MEQTFMKEKKILPLVLSMSLPMVISMAVNSLYNIVDSYFVAKLSEDAMTALALVYPIQNMINAIAIGFSIITCIPWSIQYSAISAWLPLSVAILISCKSGFSRTSFL